MSDPRILTGYDPDVMAMFDSVDDYLDVEDCECEGVCVCEEQGDPR